MLQESVLFTFNFFHTVEISLFKYSSQFWLKNFQDTNSGKPKQQKSFPCLFMFSYHDMYQSETKVTYWIIHMDYKARRNSYSQQEPQVTKCNL